MYCCRIPRSRRWSSSLKGGLQSSAVQHEVGPLHFTPSVIGQSQLAIGPLHICIFSGSNTSSVGDVLFNPFKMPAARPVCTFHSDGSSQAGGMTAKVQADGCPRTVCPRSRRNDTTVAEINSLHVGLLGRWALRGAVRGALRSEFLVNTRIYTCAACLVLIGRTCALPLMVEGL